MGMVRKRSFSLSEDDSDVPIKKTRIDELESKITELGEIIKIQNDEISFNKLLILIISITTALLMSPVLFYLFN